MALSDNTDHDTIDYGELFGVSDELAAMEDETPPAEEEDQTKDVEAIDGEPPAGEDDTPSPQPHTDHPSGAAPDDRNNKNENRTFEAAVERAIAVERDRHTAEMSELLKRSNLRNPITSEPVTTMAEFEQYQRDYARQQRENIMRRTGMTDAELDAFVGAQPEIANARRAAEEAAAARARQEIVAEVEAIKSIDPTISGAQDIIASDSYKIVSEYVQRGYKLSDAWRLANFERLAEARAARAKQQTINAARATSHMAKLPTRSSAEVEVPDDAFELYKQLVPTATAEEIRKAYAAYIATKK